MSRIACILFISVVVLSSCCSARVVVKREVETDEKIVEKQNGISSIFADQTTKRPQISDIIGGGLQNIFQGLVKAPGQIANRVQGVLANILGRATTPSPLKSIFS